jgi:hypothetical protein
MKKSLIFAAILVPAAVLLCVSGAHGGNKFFPHAKHLAQGMECDACHAAATGSENLKTTLLPAITTCTGECHDQPGLDKLGWGKIPGRVSGFPTYSHKAHLALGKHCSDCHDPARPLMGPGAGATMPNHEICFECHDGAKQPNDCGFCHATLREGRLLGFVKDPGQLKPLDHHPAYLKDHQFAVRMDGTQCSSCHRSEDFCSGCHQGDNVVNLTHERNWHYTHPVAANKNLNDCESCHEINTFCTECHLERGIRPGNHTVQWMSSGLIHGATGRKDIEICASCHDAESSFTCGKSTACHRASDDPNSRTGHSIHPPDFRNQVSHGYWHDDPGAACFYSCHTRPNPARPGVRFCGYCHGDKHGK